MAVFAAGSSKILDFVLMFHWILSTAANSLNHATILVLQKILVLVAGYILCLGSLQQFQELLCLGRHGLVVYHLSHGMLLD